MSRLSARLPLVVALSLILLVFLAIASTFGMLKPPTAEAHSTSSAFLFLTPLPPPPLIFSDDFNDNSLDTAKWNPNDLFSGLSDLNVPITETSQHVEIGPLLQNTSGSHYRGLRSVNTFNFTGGSASVELVQAASSSTAGDAMFTVGYSVEGYYRMYVSAGVLHGQKKLNGVKTDLFSVSYDSAVHRFLRIRHDSATGNVVLETALGSGGTPGTWVQRYTEPWDVSIPLTPTTLELKAGTWQSEANAAGTVIFDNFEFDNSNGASGSTGEISLLADDYNDNSINTVKWNSNDVFTGFSDLNLPINETSQHLEIGPLPQNTGGSHYRGMRSVTTYDFTGAFAYVELVQAASSSSSGDAMLSVGTSVDAYYRMYVSGGILRGQRKVGTTKTTLFSISYDPQAHRFLRIRHDSATGHVTLDTATGNGGTPGTWAQQYSEAWSSSIPLAPTVFEVKAGTFQTEANAPGTVVFDNFKAAIPGSGLPLSSVSETFNGYAAIDHHEPTNKLITSTFAPSGQPHNFELIAPDGTRTAFSNLAGITGNLRFATAHDEGFGTSLGGFQAGEVITGTNVAGSLARISANGASVQNPWVSLPGESGLVSGGLYLDRTGVFGGDLIGVTSTGSVWRVNNSGQATQIANLNTPLEGVVVVPDDPDRYGPWSGKILTSARTQGVIYAIDSQGTTSSFSFGSSITDLRIVPAHENFYGIDGTDQKVWAAPASEFSDMVGDVLIAQDTPGVLSHVRWNGEQFEVTQVAQVGNWKEIAFSPAGLQSVPQQEQVHIKIGIVRHAPEIDSGRVEGSLWQLSPDSLSLDGTDVITSDLLVPGTPTVAVNGSPDFEGVIAGTQSTQPAGYSVTIGGNSTLRHLITRTDPIQLEDIADPPAPSGMRDVSLNNANDSAGDWTTVRNLTVSGHAGTVDAPPGTYGAFSVTGRNTLILGITNSAEPTTYNFESLSLGGGSELVVVGPVVLTVKDTFTMVGATAGVAHSPQQLLLRVSGTNAESVKLSGKSVLYGIVRTPDGTVVIEGNGRLRGSVTCDRLVVSGNGVLQITDADVQPPPVNRPPVVDAGPDQTITLPVNLVNLNGSAVDDGLPSGSTLAVSWTKVSGPGAVSFSSASSVTTNATFVDAGTYVLRLTATDSLATTSDDVTVNVLSHNQAPTVSAGLDKIITLPDAAHLDGSVSDDGLPAGTTLSINWSKVSGPGTVTFGNAGAPLTTAVFSVAGTYTLRLTANDSEFQITDDAVIVVKAANAAPTVNAGTDQSITLPNNASLSGTASDDGLPSGSTLAVGWSLISGPGTVSFGTPSQVNTTATFSVSGVYTLRLTTSDSQLTSFDEIVVTVNPAVSNQAPVVNAGPDQRTTLISSVNPVNYILDAPGFMATTASPPVAISFDDIPAGTNITDTTISGVTFAIDGSPTSNAPLIVVNGYDTFTPSGYSGVQDITKNRLYPTTGDQVLSPGGLNLHPTDPLLQNDNIRMTFTQPVSAVGFDILFQSLDTLSFCTVTILGPNGETLVSTGSIPTGSDLSGGPPGGSVFVGFISSTANIKTVIVHDTDGNGTNPDSNIGLDSIRFVQSLPSGGGVTLNGTASDDGLPNPPSLVTSSWSKVSGPGTVTFGTANQLQTTATFSATGTYVLRLTGSDSALSGTDDVTVQVDPVNHAPVVRASTAHTSITLPNTDGVGGNVNDDGLPAGSVLTYSWSQLEGPGTATFSAPNSLNNVVSFSQAGFYILQLTASDGQYANSSQLGITVNPPSPTPTPTPIPSPTPTPSNQASPGWLGGPLNGSTVTGQVPITLGAGVTLTQGTIEYWPASNPSNVTVLTSSATGGPGATLATLDTTLLSNGSYVVRLTGTDSNSTQLVSLINITVAGENKPGRMVVTVTDLTVPLAGLPIKIARRYDSLERHRLDDFGMGWSLATGSVNLEINAANDITFTDPATSRRVTFKFKPHNYGFPITWGFFPAYTPEPGIFGTIATDGCQLLTRQDDGRFQCLFGQAYEPTIFAYTDSHGTVFRITADGNLQSIKTANGETLTFSPTGITSSSGGVTVAFVRDSQGRITQVTDPAGKPFGYVYNSAGDLSTVNLPETSTPVTYGYNSDHLLLTATDARGNPEATTAYYPDGRLQSITDALNQTTSYVYNLTNNTTTITNPDGGVETEQRDANGLLLSRTDPLNHTTTYTYDANRNKISKLNALNQPTTYTYDANGNQTSVTDALGRTSRATYSNVGLPLTTTNPLGAVHTFTYDANFNPTGVSDSIGTLVSMINDAQGNPTTVTDGGGGISHFTYDAAGNKLTETDQRGNQTVYTYDAMGRVLTEENARHALNTYVYDAFGRVREFTNAKDEKTTYEYDGNGNRTLQTDPLLRQTRFTYDAANRLTKVTNPDDTTVEYTYNFRGQKLTEKDQLGHITTYTYDLAGQLIKTKYVDGSEVKSSYDALGRLETATDERGNITHYEYDSGCGCSDRVTKITDALGRFTTYQYDNAGRAISSIDANNRETRYTYDARHRMTKATYPDGTLVTQVYDGANRVIAKTDQAGKTTQYGYDAAGNLTSVTDALLQPTSFVYDEANNLLSQTNANTRTTTFEYDLLNRRTKQILPLGMFETYVYDKVGNRTQRTDYRGKTTVYAYDTLHRLLSATPDASLSEPAVTFTYTPVGQRATMADASGTTTYAYDNRNRLISKQTPQGTLIYTYNAASDVQTVRSSHANGIAVDYGYDALNRLETVVDNRLGTTAYTYDAVGNLASDLRPNGVRSTYSYNRTNRLTSLSIGKSTTTLNSYSYALDPTGRRLSATERSGRVTTYAYDALYRLISETISGDPGAGANGAVSYAYDAVGNRLSRSSNIAALPSQSFTYDQNDRLSTDTYDANGNTLTSSGASFTYDFENRLKSANSGAITIVYDGDGNRVAKTVGGVTTQYLVDDLNPTGSAQVVEEIVGGQVQRQYSYGNTIVSQRQLIGGIWRSSFYGLDGHGSVRMLTDSDGVVTDTYDYDAFGNLTSHVGSTPNVYLYSGEQFDPDLGIYFQRARYYDHQRGRFLSMDPFAGVLDEPDTLHKYLYVGADPVNLTDPSGQAEFAEYSQRSKDETEQTVTYQNKHGRDIACRTINTSSFILGIAGSFSGMANLLHTATELALKFCACDLGGGPPPKIGNPGPDKTPYDLHAGGNTSGPRPPRIEGATAKPGQRVDLFPDANGNVGPTNPPTGASTFESPEQVPLTGPVWRLPKDSPLPANLKIARDGRPYGPHLPGHNTIYPAVPMSPETFINLFMNLPWEYLCKK